MESGKSGKSTHHSNKEFGIILILVLLIFIGFGLSTRRHRQENYTNALQAIDDGRYSEAKELLDTLGENYYQETDSYRKIVEQGIVYEEAQQSFNSGNYKEAIEKFSTITDFKDSKQCLLDSKYNYAIELYNNKQYKESLILLLDLDYKDSDKYTKELLPIVYNQLIESNQHKDKNS